jgi:hypothetical protein
MGELDVRPQRRPPSSQTVTAYARPGGAFFPSGHVRPWPPGVRRGPSWNLPVCYRRFDEGWRTQARSLQPGESRSAWRLSADSRPRMAIRRGIRRSDVATKGPPLRALETNSRNERSCRFLDREPAFWSVDLGWAGPGPQLTEAECDNRGTRVAGTRSPRTRDVPSGGVYLPVGPRCSAGLSGHTTRPPTETEVTKRGSRVILRPR